MRKRPSILINLDFGNKEVSFTVEFKSKTSLFQPNGAGFAGVKSNITFSSEDLTGASEILLQARAQGSLTNWKVVLTNSEFQGQQVI